MSRCSPVRQLECQQKREDYKRKDHSLFPMKLTGVARTSEIAWAGIFGRSPLVTSNSRMPTWMRNAVTLTVKKRAAWKPACPSPAAKVQWRFHQKLFITAMAKAIVAAA